VYASLLSALTAETSERKAGETSLQRLLSSEAAERRADVARLVSAVEALAAQLANGLRPTLEVLTAEVVALRLETSSLASRATDSEASLAALAVSMSQLRLQLQQILNLVPSRIALSEAQIVEFLNAPL
jgi:chromosome segregation ATPase